MSLEALSYLPRKLEKNLRRKAKRIIPLATNERYLRLGMLFKLQSLQTKNQISEHEADIIRDRIQTSERLMQLRKDLGATLAIEVAGSLYAWLITPTLTVITRDPISSTLSGYILSVVAREAYFIHSDFNKLIKTVKEKDLDRIRKVAMQSIVDIGTGWIPPAILPTVAQIIIHEHALWPLFKPKWMKNRKKETAMD